MNTKFEMEYLPALRMQFVETSAFVGMPIVDVITAMDKILNKKKPSPIETRSFISEMSTIKLTKINDLNLAFA